MLGHPCWYQHVPSDLTSTGTHTRNGLQQEQCKHTAIHAERRSANCSDKTGIVMETAITPLMRSRKVLCGAMLSSLKQTTSHA